MAKRFRTGSTNADCNSRYSEFEDFTNTTEAQSTKTRHLFYAIRKIRKSAPTADFSGELNMVLRRRARG